MMSILMRWFFVFLLIGLCANAAQPTGPIFGTVGVKPTGEGYTIIQSNNATTTNFTFTLPNANAVPLYWTAAPISGDCPQYSGTAGLVVNIACGGGGGGGTPGGSANSVQYQVNGTTFGGVSLTSGQVLLGQSGAPAAETVSGDGTLSNLGVLAVTKTGGVAFGTLATLNGAPAAGITGTTLSSSVTTAPGLTTVSGGTFAALAFLANAPAGTLTGTSLNSAITTASGLSVVAVGTLATAAIQNINTSGANVGLLNANLTFGGIDTWSSGNIRMLGSGGGYTAEASLNASGTNYTWSKPAFSGTYLGFATGIPPVNAQCPQFSGTTGLVISVACGGSGSLTVTDGFGSGPFTTTTLILNGDACAGSGSTTCSPSAPPRIVTTGTAAIVPGDMGNTIILQDNSGGTITFPVQGTGLWGNGQTVLVCNESTANWTITVTSGTGSVIILPSNPAVFPAMVNNIPSCGFFSSDGTNLHIGWWGTMPNMVYSNQVQTWTAPQRTNYSTPAISTATFTPVITASQNYRINLVHAACPCTLANFSGTLGAGQQGLIEIKQSSTGSDTIGTWGSTYQYPGGTSTITLSTAASAIDLLWYAVDSTGTIVYLSPISLNPTH